MPELVRRPPAARLTPRARVAVVLVALVTAAVAAACSDPTAPARGTAHPIAGQAQRGGAPRTSSAPQDSTRPDTSGSGTTRPQNRTIWW